MSSISTKTTTTTSEKHSRDRSEQRAREGRSRERPGLAPRQSSFSKRHSSFDTPREIPFPSPQPRESPYYFNNTHSTSTARATLDASPSFSRASSESTVTAISHPSSPRDIQPAPAHAEHEPVPGLARSLRSMKRKESFPLPFVRPSSALDRPILKMDSLGQFDVIERERSPPFFRSPLKEDVTEDYFSSSNWDSEHLRPPLLSSPRTKVHRDSMPTQLQYQQHRGPKRDSERKRSATLNSPIKDLSPGHYVNAPIASPIPSRPSSTISLPLPSQMPFFALPPTSFVENSTLSDINEQAQSVFGQAVDMNSKAESSPDAELLGRESSQLSHLQSELFESTCSIPSRNSLTTSSSGSSSSRVSTISSSSSSLPPPTPPTVHSPPPPEAFLEDESSGGKREQKKRVEYKFLNVAPPAEDVHIVTESGDNEYKLIVRLPGFDRDCIMVSTRRKRMLHIAADSWAPGGGHFERRISFGYDADLTLVRAEFDGEYLRVIVPRKDFRNSWVGPETN